MKVNRRWHYYNERAELCLCCGEGKPVTTFNGHSSLRYEWCLQCLKEHAVGPYRPDPELGILSTRTDLRRNNSALARTKRKEFYHVNT